MPDNTNGTDPTTESPELSNADTASDGPEDVSAPATSDLEGSDRGDGQEEGGAQPAQDAEPGASESDPEPIDRRGHESVEQYLGVDAESAAPDADAGGEGAADLSADSEAAEPTNQSFGDLLAGPDGGAVDSGVTGDGAAKPDGEAEVSSPAVADGGGSALPDAAESSPAADTEGADQLDKPMGTDELVAGSDSDTAEPPEASDEGAAANGSGSGDEPVDGADDGSDADGSGQGAGKRFVDPSSEPAPGAAAVSPKQVEKDAVSKPVFRVDDFDPDGPVADPSTDNASAEEEESSKEEAPETKSTIAPGAGLPGGTRMPWLHVSPASPLPEDESAEEEGGSDASA